MPDLAVVPIFVNAGAAVLPAVLGGLASAAALVLKPRELLRLVRRRPAVLVVLAAVGGLGWLGVRWIGAASAGTAKAATAAPPFDWADVGRRIVTARRLAALAPATAAAPGPTPATGPAAADVWLGRDGSRTSADGGRSPLGLADAWSHRDGDAMFLSSPAVHRGTVYAAACQLDVAGKFGYVFAADARTGKTLWRTASAIPDGEPFKAFFSSPAVTADGRRLVIGQGLHDSADCALLCLDAATGAVLWQVPTPLHIESSPAVRGDMAVVGAGAIEDANHKPTGDPGFVVAVQISTGTVLWRHPVNDPESSPAVGDDGTVYVGGGVNGNAVVALRGEPDAELAAKGLAREVWRARVPHPVTSAVTLAGDLVVVGAGTSDYVNVAARAAGRVVAVDRRTGRVAWARETGDSVLGSIAYRDGRLACPVRNGYVTMLDAATGRPIWRTRVAGGTPILAGVAFTASHVYAVTKDGWLAVLDAGDGRVVERAFVNAAGKPGENGFSLSTPTVADGRLYVGSETGGLRCFAGTK